MDLGEAAALGEQLSRMDPWARYPYPAHKLAQHLANDEPGAPRFALLLGDEIAGVASVRFNWLLGPYVQLLAVFGPYQGMGAGGAFLIWLEDRARAAGERNIWVCASDFNAAALRFYERHEFKRVADLADLVQDGRTEVLLRKRLDD